MIITNETIQDFYTTLASKYKKIKAYTDKPLTLSEKILFSHLNKQNPDPTQLVRGKSHTYFEPDRVIMQDATAQMALLQLMQSGRENVAVPSSVHCDHLILAKINALLDLDVAKTSNKEIYDFLLTVSKKYGLDFWAPGAGIIHQVALENYAMPGLMIIGTDSHTPNACGLSTLAVGVGGADAVDVMVGMPWELLMPKLIGVKLTGVLSPWCSPKDVILKLTGILTVKGGTGAIIEYFGEGVKTLSATGRATIGNMGAEVGATTSLFPFDEATADYLDQTNRKEIARLAREHRDILTPDPQVLENPEAYFDQVIEINLDTLEPHINGPYSPDIATPISDFADFIKEYNYPEKISSALIGSCTNSSFEDLSRVHSLLSFAKNNQLALKSPLWLSPGSENIYKIIEANGYLNLFKEFGTNVLANACGPCIGQWQRSDVGEDTKNSIINSFNRNFAKRADGNPNTHSFVASPEIVTAMGLAGTLLFNPLKDTLTNTEGKEILLDAPKYLETPPIDLLTMIFGKKPLGLTTPPEISERKSISVSIAPTSDRLQQLHPFAVWDGNNFEKLHLLIKAKGKCTTDHISMAGPWLKYRGHLENISQNMLIGVINAFTEKTNSVKNQLTGEYDNVPDVAAAYRDESIGSIVIGDENYGEGSSREHAAMEPRFMGVKVVLAKSFARIHETNLKKQGLLPLLFVNPVDYDVIQEDDRVDILGVVDIAPAKNMQLVLHHSDGSSDSIEVRHTMNTAQIAWFKEGSALNLIKKNFAT